MVAPMVCIGLEIPVQRGVNAIQVGGAHQVRCLRRSLTQVVLFTAEEKVKMTGENPCSARVSGTNMMSMKMERKLVFAARVMVN